MKKRKGKQATPEAAISSEEPEATAIASAPAEGDAVQAAPPAEDTESDSAPVALVGDDEVTTRMDLRSSRKGKSRAKRTEDEATAPVLSAAEENADADAADTDTSDDEPTVVDRRVPVPAPTLADGAAVAEGDVAEGDVAVESEPEGQVSAEAGRDFGDPLPDALSPEGVSPEGMSTEGMSTDGTSTDGQSAEGAPEALSPDALPTEGPRLESVLESILFASDRPLGITDLKRLLGERDGKRLTTALESLRDKRADAGIQLVSVAGGWQLRTHPGNGAWVSKLVAGRPPRLSRAMMETLSIVAYRQPITRPEIDEIRGVDCGPVLHTLLDRGLIRVIGKKEEVGRPMLYGTTPEFLKTFSLKDLSDLPTLREFHELGAEDRARVDATAAEGSGASVVAITDEAGAPASALPAASARPVAGELSDPDPEEEDALLEALDDATSAAARATASPTDPNPELQPEGASASPPSSDPGE